MNKSDVLAEFEAAGALQKGHFILSSGLHSDTYLNKSIVSMYPERTERLCRALAAKARKAFDGEFGDLRPGRGIEDFKTHHHLLPAFKHAALNTRLGRREAILVGPVGG